MPSVVDDTASSSPTDSVSSPGSAPREPAVENRLPVAELGRDIHFNRQPREVLDQVLPDERRVPGGAARHETQSIELNQVAVAQCQLGDLDQSGTDLFEGAARLKPFPLAEQQPGVEVAQSRRHRTFPAQPADQFLELAVVFAGGRGSAQPLGALDDMRT